MSRKKLHRHVSSRVYGEDNKEEILNKDIHSMPNGMAMKIILYFGSAIGMLVLSIIVLSLLVFSSFVLGI